MNTDPSPQNRFWLVVKTCIYFIKDIRNICISLNQQNGFIKTSAKILENSEILNRFLFSLIAKFLQELFLRKLQIKNKHKPRRLSKNSTAKQKKCNKSEPCRNLKTGPV